MCRALIAGYFKFGRAFDPGRRCAAVADFAVITIPSIPRDTGGRPMLDTPQNTLPDLADLSHPRAEVAFRCAERAVTWGQLGEHEPHRQCPPGTRAQQGDRVAYVIEHHRLPGDALRVAGLMCRAAERALARATSRP